MRSDRPRFYRCACCGAHALANGNAEAVCPLCKWSADGSNGEYDLAEARENVRGYGIMFRPSDVRFARLRHPILGPAGETAIDRVALRGRIYAEFEQLAQGRGERLELPERLLSLLTILHNADTLYVHKI